MDYLKAFVLGGAICVVGQILVDKTKLTPARILVSFVVAGVALKLIGVYEYLVQWGGAGATVPLTGFGYNLCKGVEKAVSEKGWIGIFTGGLTAASAGISAAIVAGLLVSMIFHSKSKK
jgi:stage V sporulation protein AE